MAPGCREAGDCVDKAVGEEAWDDGVGWPWGERAEKERSGCVGAPGPIRGG